MKKGQLFGQPLVYIFIAIVSVLVLVFGINLAKNLGDVGSTVITKVFYEDVGGKLNSVYSDSLGSVISLESIKVPSSLREVCFIDRSYEIDSSVVQDSNLKKIIEESFNSEDDKNFFIMADEIDIKKLNRIELDESIICDDLSDGKVNIKFINNGLVVKAQHI